MELAIIGQRFIISLNYQIVLVGLPLRDIDLIGSDCFIDRRCPALKIIGESHRIFRFGSSDPLCKPSKDNISLTTVDATVGKLIGDRELCLLPFSDVRDVPGYRLGNIRLPAIELPAVLARLIAYELGRGHASQDILCLLFSKFSVLAGFVGNRVALLFAIGDVVAVGILVIDDGDLHIGGHVAVADEALSRELVIRANGDVALDSGDFRTEGCAHLDILINILLQGSRPLFPLVIGVGHLHVAGRHDGEVPVEVVASVRGIIASGPAVLPGRYLKAEGVIADFTAPLHCVEVHCQASVVRVPDNLSRMRLDIGLNYGVRSRELALAHGCRRRDEARDVNVAHGVPAVTVGRPTGGLRLEVNVDARRTVGDVRSLHLQSEGLAMAGRTPPIPSRPSMGDRDRTRALARDRASRPIARHGGDGLIAGEPAVARAFIRARQLGHLADPDGSAGRDPRGDAGLI